MDGTKETYILPERRGEEGSVMQKPEPDKDIMQNTTIMGQELP